jgi:lipopolysaccharide transport system ATP-binding protein
MGRIEEIGRSGRTVLFVSHDLPTVARLCERAYCLDGGKIVLTGPSDDVVAKYLQMLSGAGAEVAWAVPESSPGDELVRLRSARVVDAGGRVVDAIDVRQPVGIEISFSVLRDGEPVFPKIKVTDERGNVAFNALDTDPRWREPAQPGDYVATAWIPGNLLNEGHVAVDVALASLDAPKLDHHVNLSRLLTFHVQDSVEGDSSKGVFTGQLQGVVRPKLEWSVERRSA